MELIYAFGNAVIPNERGRGRIVRKANCRSIRCNHFIAAKQAIIGTSGIEVIVYANLEKCKLNRSDFIK